MPSATAVRAKSRRITGVAGLASLLIVASALAPALAENEQEPGTLASCLHAVKVRNGDEISCDYNVLIPSAEREEMRKLSRGLLEDASCVVEVRIARSLVEPALEQGDHVFEAPPQPMTCTIKTKDGDVSVTGTFAPKVTFAGGLAIDGTLGLSNVTGINKYLAWPIVEYVNRSARVRSDMLSVINFYRAKLVSTP